MLTQRTSYNGSNNRSQDWSQGPERHCFPPLLDRHQIRNRATSTRHSCHACKPRQEPERNQHPHILGDCAADGED
jgi:hypothetical protein